MPKIERLSSHVADLIAAGEVVERPGSVIKELVENAIDAGATALTVEIQNGGMLYMRVTDNGCGIAEEDVETAFLRHATSKLKDARGLEAISTLGFRGEALAAIAAVSKIEVTTREKDAEEGAFLRLEGGVTQEKRAVGCPEGTTMIVRELFYNTPARLKFMKNDRAEGANVSGVVTRCALSHPEVSVRYIKDGKEEYHTPGDGRMDSCVYSLLGRDFALGLLKAESDDGEVSVTGYVSTPGNARGNRSYQFFFVNGRFVKSKLLQAAVEQAYKNTLFTGRFPACVLYICLSPAAVDVNVHPTKTEVKFLRERQVFDAVYYAVLAALQGERQTAEMEISGGTHRVISNTVWSANADKTQAEQKQEKAAAPVRSETQTSWKPEKEAVPRPAEREVLFSTFQTAGEPEKMRPAQMEAPQMGAAAVHDEIHVDYKTGANLLESEKQESFLGQMPTSPVRAEQEPVQRTEEEVPFRVIGEGLGTYILVEKEDSLYLIDKHAAHERILFDKLMAEKESPLCQPLLAPVVCEMNGENLALLEQNREMLTAAGFEIDLFGETSVIVRQVPADIDTGDIRPMLEEMCERLSVSGKTGFEDRRDAVLHTVACKAAIKAGKRSQPQELEQLAGRVLSGEIRYCPHGRPVAAQLTKQTIDKFFKRI